MIDGRGNRGNHGASPSGQPVASAVLLQCQLHSAARWRFTAHRTSGQEDLPGLGFPSGHALPQPLGVRSQVVDQLSADLIRGLDGVGVLQNRADTVQNTPHISINNLLIINMNPGSFSSLLMSLQHEHCLKKYELIDKFSLFLMIYCKWGSCSAEILILICFAQYW